MHFIRYASCKRAEIFEGQRQTSGGKTIITGAKMSGRENYELWEVDELTPDLVPEALSIITRHKATLAIIEADSDLNDIALTLARDKIDATFLGEIGVFLKTNGVLNTEHAPMALAEPNFSPAE